jgi:hypothetical protein
MRARTLIACVLALGLAIAAEGQALKASQQKALVGNAAGTITVNDATNNATSTVLTVSHTTSGTPTNGLGPCINFAGEDSANAVEVLSSVCGAFSDVTTTSEDGFIALFTRAAGAALTERLRVNSTGEVGIGKTATVGVELDVQGDTATSTLAVGGGTAVVGILTATASLDFTAISANACEDLTVTVTGAAANDSVALGMPAALYETGASYSGWVSSSNTVSVRRCNESSGALTNVAAATVRVTVIKY